MHKHHHICVCGKRFGCIVRILPAPPIGRTRCEEWPESICPECFESMIAGADDRIEVLNGLIEIGDIDDPLTAWRARNRLKEF